MVSPDLGTYTYDLIVLEYGGANPVWTQGEALDWNFLKRYRDGYHLWVPEKLPSPHGDDDGHDVWTHIPEDGPAEMRGYYCTASDYSNNDVDRGNDVEIQVVDSELAEKGSAGGGPAAVGLIGADYGTVDSDEDDHWDGLSLYTYQDSDPAGTWRAIFMAEDVAGYRSPAWRTHSAVRMLTANRLRNHRKLAVVLDPGHGAYKDNNGQKHWRGAVGVRYDPWPLPHVVAQFREDDVVLDVAEGARAFLEGLSRTLVAGVELTRTDEWDIGDGDRTGQVGPGWRDILDPAGSLHDWDRRNRLTKDVVDRNPEVDVVYVSLHVNWGFPAETGPFNKRDERQWAVGDSEALGDSICDQIVAETSMPRDADERGELGGLWWNSCDLWTAGDILQYSGAIYHSPTLIAEAITGLPTAQADWRRRRGIPAILIETMQFDGNQDWIYVSNVEKRKEVGGACGRGIMLRWLAN